MSINLTDEIEVKTKKGKLCAAKQIFLEGDMHTVEKEIQDINSRHNTLNTKYESLSKTVQNIAVTGGASTATNVTYNNDTSRLNAENTQDAIDEISSIVTYDVSARNNGIFFKSLSALLSDSNLDTLIPVLFRHGGMTIRFIQGSEQNTDNKYVQFRLMSNAWSTTVADWQGIDDEPTVGSDNLVKSRGVADKISELEGIIGNINFSKTTIAYGYVWGYPLFVRGKRYKFKINVSLNSSQHLYVIETRSKDNPEEYFKTLKAIYNSGVSEFEVTAQGYGSYLFLRSDSNNWKADISIIGNIAMDTERIDPIQNIAESAYQDRGNFICVSAQDSVVKYINGIKEVSQRLHFFATFKAGNTANNVVIEINGTQYPLLLNGHPTSPDNTWEANEILDFIFDGTNFLATKFIMPVQSKQLVVGDVTNHYINGEADVSNGKVVVYEIFKGAYVLYKFDVKEDMEFVITISGGIAPRAFIFADDDNNVIYTSEALEDFVDYHLRCPKSATKLYLNANKEKKIKVEYKGINYSYSKNITKEHLVDINKVYLNNGVSVTYNDVSNTSKIWIKGAKSIYVSVLNSNSYPTAIFYSEFGDVIGIISGSTKYKQVYGLYDIPDGTCYVVVNAINSITYIELFECKIFGNIEQVKYRVSNPFVFLTKNESKDVVVATDYTNEDPNVALARIPTIYSNGDSLYIASELRYNGDDKGIIHVAFAKYENGREVSHKIILKSSLETGRYMNPVVYYDNNGILGTLNRLYVFYLKSDKINKYVTDLLKSESHFCYIYSDNEGQDWSVEQSLDSYKPDVKTFATSPSNALVANGVLYLPAYVVMNDNSFRTGVTRFSNGWHLDVIDLRNSKTDNECCVSMFHNKSILVNARNFYSSRSVYYYEGNKYKEHETNKTFNVHNTYGCHGSVIKVGEYWLMSNVDSIGTGSSNNDSRRNLCIFLSYNLITWYPVVYIHKASQGIIDGYSNLFYDGNTIKCVYENVGHKISVVDITEDINKAIENKKGIFLSCDTDALLSMQYVQNL